MHIILIFLVCLNISASSGAKSLPPKYDVFFTWMKEQGAKFDKVELRDEHPMRGMFAKEDIKKNEMIVYVPDHLISSVEKAKSSPIGKDIMKNAPDTDPHAVLYAPNADLLAI